jgi:hypothetical protein
MLSRIALILLPVLLLLGVAVHVFQRKIKELSDLESAFHEAALLIAIAGFGAIRRASLSA